MVAAVEILDVYFQPIRDWEDTILFYIALTQVAIVSLLVRYTMCILSTPMLYCIYTVLIEVYLQCFTESVSLRDIGKPTSRTEISTPRSLYHKPVKGAHLGSALEVCYWNSITVLLEEVQRIYAPQYPIYFIQIQRRNTFLLIFCMQQIDFITRGQLCLAVLFEQDLSFLSTT